MKWYVAYWIVSLRVPVRYLDGHFSYLKPVEITKKEKCYISRIYIPLCAELHYIWHYCTSHRLNQQRQLLAVGWGMLSILYFITYSFYSCCCLLPRLHDTAGCQTGCQTGLTTGWMFVYTIQPVVKPVWQPVWQSVVSCIQTFTRLSKGLYRVNGALEFACTFDICY